MSAVPMNPLNPLRDNTLGILGGGQLGRMLVHAAQRMGLHTCVLDPDAQAPAMRACDWPLVGAYDDPQALARLAQRCAHISTEFENVPATSLAWLAIQPHTQVAPSASAVQMAQDRVAEKRFFEQLSEISGVGPVPWAAIEHPHDLANAPVHLLPGILKTTRLGYDGKGQARVNTAAELVSAWADLKHAPCVLEQRVDLALECSVIIARGPDGRVVRLPLQINAHRNGILHSTRVGFPPENLEHFRHLASDFKGFVATENIANALQYVGVLCVEFFVLTNGQVHINEMAPRPHNSGHHSMESCDLSQFELQARAAMGWPLVQPQMRSPAIMFNIMGDAWVNGHAPDFQALMSQNGVHLHLYGKDVARPGRKMGHITVTGDSCAQVNQRAKAVEAIMGFAP